MVIHQLSDSDTTQAPLASGVTPSGRIPLDFVGGLSTVACLRSCECPSCRQGEIPLHSGPEPQQDARRL